VALASGVAALCVVVATAIPGTAASTVSIALVCGWSCCLALVWSAVVALTWRWRLTREDPAAWLTTASVCGAVYLTSCVVRLYVGFASGGEVAALEGVDVVMVGVWLVLARRATVHPHAVPRMGPIWLGVLLGLAGAVLQIFVLLVDADAISDQQLPERMAVLGLGLCGLAALSQARHMSASMRRQLLLICGIGTLSRIVAPAAPTQPGVAAALSLACGVVAAALLCRVGAILLVQARAQAEAITELAMVASGGASRSEQLHEVRASFAGLASAVRLLAGQEGELSVTRRTDLGTMLTAEVDRLERLLNGRPAESLPDVDLDAVLRSLVIARQLAGQRVDWVRTGCHVEGSPDLIATAVNMLLVNASVHAPGSQVRVRAETHGGSVRIRVTDNGPGVAANVQPRLFTRGGRREGSPGHGIGLHFAGRLAAVQGGSLHLANGQSGATTFELTLPSSQIREVK